MQQLWLKCNLYTYENMYSSCHIFLEKDRTFITPQAPPAEMCYQLQNWGKDAG